MLAGVSLGIVSGTSLTVNGLAPATTYSLSVRAGDAAGNWSALTAPLNVTTAADTSSPSAPGSLRASNVTASLVALEWSPSTDNVGVKGYEVKQGETSLGWAPGNYMTITGLSASVPYTFGVRAWDMADNCSAWSSIVVTTATNGADTLLGSTVFSSLGQATQTYTVPGNADYVVIKAWGAGGGGGSAANLVGGNGTYTSATYLATPGDTFSISVGNGGIGRLMQGNSLGLGGWPGGSSSATGGGGGGFSKIETPYGSVWAEGGAGGGSGGGAGGSVGKSGRGHGITLMGSRLR